MLRIKAGTATGIRESDIADALLGDEVREVGEDEGADGGGVEAPGPTEVGLSVRTGNRTAVTAFPFPFTFPFPFRFRIVFVFSCFPSLSPSDPIFAPPRFVTGTRSPFGHE